MSKIEISKLFLYRYRFKLGYILLALAYVGLLFALPAILPSSLSSAEMQSVTDSYNLHFSSVTSGDLVDLPYHIVQKICILLFGFSTYAIKLPSIIVGIFLGLLLILLLNRWFKSNVAIFASVITVLSIPFLYLAGSGTPLIMLVFWPTLLLWLGSKIQGVTKPRPFYSFIFAFALFLSLFTPHLVYLVTFIVIFAFAQPHLRFTIKNLPKIPFMVVTLMVLAGLGVLIANIISNPSVAITLLFSKNFTIDQYFHNIAEAFRPLFLWGGTMESIYLSPLIGLATFLLALTGLFSTRKGFFASRNSIASCFIIFTILLSGLNPDSVLLLILPLSILVAHGLRYILTKWYSIFPKNPYARVSAVIPIALFLGIIIISDLTHYIYGYSYAPSVANEFNEDLMLIEENLNHFSTLVIKKNTLEYDFYEVYEDRTHNITLVSEIPDEPGEAYATLGQWEDKLPTISKVYRIVTSPKKDNSDRIYIYNNSES